MTTRLIKNIGELDDERSDPRAGTPVDPRRRDGD